MTNIRHDYMATEPGGACVHCGQGPHPSTLMTDTLANCPFCWTADHVRAQENGLKGACYWEVVCDKCEISGPAHGTPGDAIAAWNRRALPSPDVAVREALRGKPGMAAWIANEMEMDDLVERLEKRTDGKYYGDVAILCGEAAALITSLREAREAALASSRPAMADDGDPFQERVTVWMRECFGPIIPYDKVERGDRLLEEVLELLQADGYDGGRVIALLNYVYDRPKGVPHQELGGVMVTVAAYAAAFGYDMDKAADDELARVWTKIDKIRAKQAAKPTGSALPCSASPSPDIGEGK